MYSTIQAWNADETRLLLYKRPGGLHILLDGFTYQYIKDLDINPSDLEEVFWHFEDPDILFYMDADNSTLIEYNVETGAKIILANLRELTACNELMESGNDVQMMSWDSDIFTFRCGTSTTWSYQNSTGKLTEILVSDLQFASAMPFPSGQLYLQGKDVYNADGSYSLTLDVDSGKEHSCIGRDSEGNDNYYAIAFAQSPDGGCLGEVIAYEPITGICKSIIGTDLGYSYHQSGTHISALSHKNTEGGWLTASMIGYDQDGQELLDQELIIAQVGVTSSNVYRIAHHRSDEDEYDYWGEPHPVMSPSGTRVIFNSDWSGSEDGFAVDTYVVELPIYDNITSSNNHKNISNNLVSIYPNPFDKGIHIEGLSGKNDIQIINFLGEISLSHYNSSSTYIDLSSLPIGSYYINIQNSDSKKHTYKKIVKTS